MSKIQESMNRESRFNKEVELSVRAVEEGSKKYLEGYAALYGVRSTLIFENGKKFIEVIESGAFRGILGENPDVKLTLNHDKNILLARSTSQTLELSEDSKGLHFRALIGSSYLWNSTIESVERGDLNAASFYFGAVRKDIRWEHDGEVMVRHIERVAALMDVSVVADAAYRETSLQVAQRQLEEIQANEFTGAESDKMRLALLKLK